MYRILMDGDPIATPQAEQLTVLDPQLNLEANAAGTLKFTLLPDHPAYDSIQLRQSIIDVELNGENIFEGIPVSERTDFYKRKTIECEGDLTFLNDTIQRQAVYQQQTTATLLGTYLAIHNSQADAAHQFELGAVTVDGGASIYRYTNYNTTMAEISEDLVADFGGYIRVRHENGHRYLDYLAASPRTSRQVIRIGRNLVDLSKNLSSLDICTVLIPLGARTGNKIADNLEERLTIKSVNNDRDYLVGSAASIYGQVWKTQIWDDVTTPSALKTKGEAYLDTVQWANLVIEASAVDLGLTGEDVEQFRILDMIRVISEPHGIDRSFMLTKLSMKLDRLGDTQITLGQDIRLNLTQQTAQATAQINGKLETLPSSILAEAQRNAKAILEMAGDGHIHFTMDQNGVWQEMLIMDTDDVATATKIWRWNLNGWGYSGDGGQTYTIAATMNGAILASMITTGTMLADRIRGGTLELGGQNNGNGILKVFNSSGVQKAQLDNTGLLSYSTEQGNALKSVLDGKSLLFYGNSTPTLAVASFYARNSNTPYTGFGCYKALFFMPAAGGSVGFRYGGASGNSDDSGDYGAPFYFGMAVRMASNLTVEGTKNRAARTEHYGERLLYAYETPAPLFGDVGDGLIDESGICVVDIDDIFAETSRTDIQYQVFLQPLAEGDIWVEERTPMYFTVKGTPGLPFSWEIKAKQAGYETERLDRADLQNLDTKETNYDEIYGDMIEEFITEQEAEYGND